VLEPPHTVNGLDGEDTVTDRRTGTYLFKFTYLFIFYSLTLINSQIMYRIVIGCGMNHLSLS
jgi:hypothetical protein